jgi:hypothetical protein
MYSPIDVAVGFTIESITDTLRERQTVLRMVTVRPTLTYASGIASPVATRDGGGPKK